MLSWLTISPILFLRNFLNILQCKFYKKFKSSRGSLQFLQRLRTFLQFSNILYGLQGSDLQFSGFFTANLLVEIIQSSVLRIDLPISCELIITLLASKWEELIFLCSSFLSSFLDPAPEPSLCGFGWLWHHHWPDPQPGPAGGRWESPSVMAPRQFIF